MGGFDDGEVGGGVRVAGGGGEGEHAGGFGAPEGADVAFEEVFGGEQDGACGYGAEDGGADAG